MGKHGGHAQLIEWVSVRESKAEGERKTKTKKWLPYNRTPQTDDEVRTISYLQS